MRLTVKEASRLLNLPVSTVQRWIRQGKIPAYRQSGKYVFVEKDLKKWAESRGIIFATEVQPPHVDNATQEYRLFPAMKRGGVLHGIRGDNPSAVLEAIVEAAPVDPFMRRDELFARLIEREELAPTGLGHGVAIPHPRSPLQSGPGEPIITTCFLETPVEYGAIDHVPVFVLFLMLSPSPKIHLRLLAKLSHLLRDSSFVEFLRRMPSPDDLLSKVYRLEAEINSPSRPSKDRNPF